MAIRMAVHTMATPNNKEVLSKLLTCAICLDRYSDPRILPCHHTYCKDCIDGLSTGQLPKLVKCPECRKAYQLSTGASVLPSAFLVNNLLEILGNSGPLSVSCPKHNKPNNVFCEKCEELICFRCSHETHRDHPSDLVEDLFEKHRQQISDSLQPMDKRITEVSQMLVMYRETEKEIRTKGEVVKKEIRKAAKQQLDRLRHVKKELEQSMETLIRQVDITTSQKLELNALEKSELETVLVKLTSCKESVEKKLASQNQYEILTTKTKTIQFVTDAHSKIKLSELQPGQNADTAFEQLPTIFKPLELGSVTSTLNFQSVQNLFLAKIPQCVPVRESTIISVMTSLSDSFMPARDLHCYLIRKGEAFFIVCSVDQIAKGHFNVVIKPEQPGLHELIISIGVIDAPVYVHKPFEVPVLSIGKWRESRLKKFAYGLKYPCSLAITDDVKHLIIAEHDRNCVAIYSADTGKFVRRFGRNGSRPGEFMVVTSLDGYIFVKDSNRILKFVLNGKCVASTGRLDVGNGMVVLSNGDVILSSPYNLQENKLVMQKLRLNFSNLLTTASDEVIGKALDMAIDTHRILYVLTKQYGIHKFVPNSTYKYIDSFGSEGTQLHQFQSPSALCIDSNNTIYVADGQKVKMYTTDGQFLGSFGSYSVLSGIAVSKNGDLFICNVDGDVLVSRDTRD